jgi:hypothetical protein
MKPISRLFVLAALSMAIVIPSVAVPLQDPTVYGTKTGKKYHRETCSSLRKSKIAMKLTEAKFKGLTACKKCKPAE